MKRIFLAVISLMMIIALSGCNRQLVDSTYKFDRAIIELPTGEIIDGAVESWMDYEDGDQIQVKIKGVTYLVHSSNVVLIKD